eukprot:6001924-Pyramimonas_sp.AAC.1
MSDPVMPLHSCHLGPSLGLARTLRLCRASLLRESTVILRACPPPMQERLAAAAARRELASAEGKALAPRDFGRGAKRGLGKGGGPRGASMDYKGTHKPRAAHALPRDPTAQSKLQIRGRAQ